MKFREKREKIKGLLLCAGVKELSQSKAHIPAELPAGIVSAITRVGDIPVDMGFLERLHTFEVHIVVEYGEDADEVLDDMMGALEDSFLDEMQIVIERVEYYDALMKADPVKIGKFEVSI
jgi:hypothetical protein